MANTSTVIEVESRAGRGKNACRRLRAGGKIPGNVYGMDAEPFAVAVNPRRVGEVLRLVTGRNTILKLTLDGGNQSRDVMIRELQRDPVRDDIVHVDFIRVDPTKEMHVKIPIHLVGLAEGVKNEGGFLDFVHREVEVACLPGAIPERFDVDVTELHINQHVSFSDLQVVEGIQILDDPETIIAVVAITKAEEVEPETEEEGDVAEGEAAAAEGDEKEGAEGQSTEPKA